MSNIIKLEQEYRLENILVSLDIKDLNKLNDILAIKGLDILEKSDLNKFIYLSNQTGAIPNVETLKKEFPNLSFDTYNILPVDEINDYIKIYIARKKNSIISKELMKLSIEVKENGLDENTIEQLNNITKSDVISIEYKDIQDDLLNIYKGSTLSERY